jgi:hypothetical protein
MTVTSSMSQHNPENVMLELKYRYDREIDFAEHPVLRKILEKDDFQTDMLVCCKYLHTSGQC